jgi:thiol-disulfide isomerase/thioredoxin
MKKIALYLIILTNVILNAQNPVKIGDFAPQINITDTILNCPKDFTLKNKFIVLEFWATWCKPCLKAVPKLNLLEEKFSKNKNLVFLSITDESPEKVMKTLKNVYFKSIVISDQSGITINSFIKASDGSYAIPATILIDDNNIVKWIGNPNELDEKILKKFLNKENNLKSEENGFKKIDQPIFRKESEASISDITYKIINNDTSQFSFSLIRNKQENNFLNLNYLKSKKTYMDFNKSLEGILANLNKVNRSQIIIPDSLRSRNYSLFYKNITLKNENDGLDDIKNKIQDFFGLHEKIIQVNQKNYSLEMVDENKFENFRNTPISILDSETSQFSFSNCDLGKIFQEIANFYKINIKDEANLYGNYSFLLPNNSLEKTNEALQNYGLNLKLISEKTPIYIYE